MTAIRLICTFLTLDLLAATALPASADNDDDRGEQRLRREQGPGQRRPPAAEIERHPASADTQHSAQPGPRPDVRDDSHRGSPGVTHTPVRVAPPARRDAPKPPPGFVLDPRHGHNHYYPPHGRIEPTLPPERYEVRYHDHIYYYYRGIWYRPSGTRFVVVLPPFGIVVPVLPPFYTILWVGLIPYYYADSVYYQWQPYYHNYIVAEPPPDSEILDTQAGEALTVQPLRGQNDEQMAKDRYECDRQATEQTGYDPTKPGGNVPHSQRAGKRADYFKVATSCLEARGYRVQ